MVYEYEQETRIDMGALFGAVIRRIPRILLITLILLIATYFLLSIVPPKYRSSASILVEPRENIFTRASDGQPVRQTGSDPSAVSSQVELIKSRDNLMKVIEKEGLRDIAEFNHSNRSLLGSILAIFRPSEETKSPDERILLAIAKNLKVTQLRGTRVISVTFSSTNPELAARIANSIANMHVLRRAELSVSDTAEASSWLAKEIETMREKVAKAEAEVAKYRINNNLYEGSNNTNLLDQQLSLITEQIAQAQERKSAAQLKVEQINAILKQGGALENIPDIRDSAIIQRLIQDKARLQGERAQLLASFLPNHPNVQAISAQIMEIDNQIRQEARKVANSLEAEANIQSQLEQSLRDDLVRLKMELSDATKKSVMLNQLEREAKAQRDLLNTYLIRYQDASARTDSTSSLPDVRVVSVAAPAIEPYFPKKTLILLAVGIVAIIFQILQILSSEFMSGRALKEVRIMRYDDENEIKEPIATGLVDEGKENPDESRHTIGFAPSTTQSTQVQKIDLDKDVRFLSEKIINSKQQTILVASLGASNEKVIKKLSANLVQNNKSVIEIDAGSRKISPILGISDLSMDKADFGEIIQRRPNSNFALIAWGQSEKINLNSQKCNTLIAALSEIFEAIIVDVGEIGVISSLPAFAQDDVMCVLVVDNKLEHNYLDKIKEDINLLGIKNIIIIPSLAKERRVA